MCQLVGAAPCGDVPGVSPKIDLPEAMPFASALRELSGVRMEAKLKLYREFYVAWFGEMPLWSPATPSAVIAVGAFLKASSRSEELPPLEPQVLEVAYSEHAVGDRRAGCSAGGGVGF